MTKHTPLPWHKSKDNSGIFIAGNGGRIAEVFYGQKITTKHQTEQEANAAFIVKCCNSHYELLAALKELSSHATKLNLQHQRYDKAREAIAKAEGGAA